MFVTKFVASPESYIEEVNVPEPYCLYPIVTEFKDGVKDWSVVERFVRYCTYCFVPRAFILPPLAMFVLHTVHELSGVGVFPALMSIVIVVLADVVFAYESVANTDGIFSLITDDVNVPEVAYTIFSNAILVATPEPEVHIDFVDGSNVIPNGLLTVYTPKLTPVEALNFLIVLPVTFATHIELSNLLNVTLAGFVPLLYVPTIAPFDASSFETVLL